MGKILFFIFLLSCLFYGNTVFNGYNIDDENVVLNHPLASKGIKALPKIFTSSYLEGYNANNDRCAMGYRPITVASFAVEHQLWGANPHISHFVNIILYGLTCVLLFLLLRKIFYEYNIVLPLLAVTLFAIHPIHSEVVNSLKNREDILALLFGLLSFWMFIDYALKGKIWRIGLGILLLLISFMTKTVALPLLFIIPLSLYFFYRTPLKKGALYSVLLVMPYFLFKVVNRLLVYTPLEKKRLNSFYENPLYGSGHDWLDRLSYAFYIFLYQVKMMFVPAPLRVYYGYNMIKMPDWSSWGVWAGIGISAALLGMTIYFYRRNKALSFGVLFFMSAAAMYVNFVQIVPGIFAERHLYLPSIGWAVVVAICLLWVCRVQYQKAQEPLQWNYPIVIIALLLTLSCAYITIKRNAQWEDKLTLLSHDVKKGKKSFKMNIMLAEIYASRVQSGKLQKPDEEKAAFYYKQAIDVYPNDAQALAYYGGFLAKKGQIESAAPHIHKALALAPNNGWANFFMGFIKHHNADYQEAFTYYSKALPLLPNEVDAYINLGRVCYMLQKYDMAEVTGKEGLRKFPKNEFLIDNLINVYYMTKDKEKLLQYYQELKTINPEKAKEYDTYIK